MTSARRFEVQILPDLAWDEFLRRFRHAEARGFDVASTADQFVDWKNPSVPWFDVWTALAAAAQGTERIRLAPCVAQIPMRDPEAPLRSTSEEAESSLALIRVHVSYDDEGVPSVLSISSRDIEDALGYSLRQTQLQPEFIDKMQDAGVQHLTIRTTPNGLVLWSNDSQLPYLAWSDDNLRNTAMVVDDMVALYNLPEWDAVREAVNLMLPLLDNVDGEFVLLFPVPEDVESIEIPQP